MQVCTPNAVISCNGDELTSCNADGTAQVTDMCGLGCAAGEARCNLFTPTNGLASLLQDARSEPDVTLPAGTRIDTDSGLVQDANGNPIAIKTTTISQVGAASIRVYEAHSLSTADVSVTGTNGIALVVWGDVAIRGRISVRAHGSVAGPGAQTSGACAGHDAQQYTTSCPSPNATGAGGAGNYQAGGQGGVPLGGPNGGSTLNTFSPLAGGCQGGNQLDVAGTAIAAHGGGGGGAVQIVSQIGISLADQGLLDVGAGGGQSTAGGGSGGLVILEAPSVTFLGNASGIAANGGAGGGCQMTGPDASTTLAAAPGASCANFFAGSGGTGAAAPGTGCRSGIDSCNGGCPSNYGGGGGSVGRARIATKTGAYAMSSTPILSVHVTQATLSVQ